MHYLICQHAGLPRAGSGYHKFGAVHVFHSGSLLIVKFVEIIIIRC